MTTLVILGATALHILVAATILGSCLLVGLFILPASWLPGQGWHDLPVALSAGVTAVGLVMWITATTLATWAALLAAGLLVMISLGKIPQAWRASVSLVRRVVPLMRRHPITAALILATIVLLIPQLALPPMASDAIRYHLAEPKLALLTGKLSFDPYNLTTGLPQIIEMLDLVTIAIDCAGAAKAIQAIFFMLNLVLLMLIVHRGRRTRRAAMLAPLLFAWSPVSPPQQPPSSTMAPCSRSPWPSCS